MKIRSSQELGILVQQERKKRAWTQADLASQAGVQPLWISQFERGKTSVQIGLVFRTLKALELTLSVGDTKGPGDGRARVIDLDSLVQATPEEEEVVVKPDETRDSTTRKGIQKEDKKGTPE